MSRVGNPYDNAKAESFMKTLKQEEVYGSDYRDVEDARGRIRTFIDEFYNRQRLHSALDYLPPEEYEAKLPKLRTVPDSRVSPKGCSPCGNRPEKLGTARRCFCNPGSGQAAPRRRLDGQNERDQGCSHQAR